MKKWAVLVVMLYFLALVALTAPVCLFAFPAKWKLASTVFYSEWAYWIIIAVMTVSQAVLLAVPVKVAGRRPVTRRSLAFSFAVSGLMIGVLAVSVILCLREFIMRDFEPGAAANYILIGALIWLFWAVFFYRLNRDQEPINAFMRQIRCLLAGSILELLVAVPMHIIVRNREYCCAGFSTLLGLTMGLAVMLFSFGPGVFFLFADRWRRLRPQKPAEGDAPADA